MKYRKKIDSLLGSSQMSYCPWSSLTIAEMFSYWYITQRFLSCGRKPCFHMPKMKTCSCLRLTILDLVVLGSKYLLCCVYKFKCHNFSNAVCVCSGNLRIIWLNKPLPEFSSIQHLVCFITFLSL